MIIERCEKIIKKIERLQQLQVAQQEIANFNKRSQELNQICDNIEADIKSYRLIVQHCSEFTQQSSLNISKEQEVISTRRNTIYKAFNQDPTSLTRGKNYNNLICSLNNLNDKIQQYNQEIWEKYKLKKGKELSFGIQVVNIIPTFQESIDNIKEQKEQFDELTQNIPENEDVFTHIENIVVKVKKMTTQFPDTIPENVALFLMDVRNNVALASMLLEDEELINWLRKYNILDKLSVGF